MRRSDFQTRQATLADEETLLRFTLDEAEEAEGRAVVVEGGGSEARASDLGAKKEEKLWPAGAMGLPFFLEGLPRTLWEVLRTRRWGLTTGRDGPPAFVTERRLMGTREPESDGLRSRSLGDAAPLPENFALFLFFICASRLVLSLPLPCRSPDANLGTPRFTIPSTAKSATRLAGPLMLPPKVLEPWAFFAFLFAARPNFFGVLMAFARSREAADICRELAKANSSSSLQLDAERRRLAIPVLLERIIAMPRRRGDGRHGEGNGE